MPEKACDRIFPWQPIATSRNAVTGARTLDAESEQLSISTIQVSTQHRKENGAGLPDVALPCAWHYARSAVEMAYACNHLPQPARRRACPVALTSPWRNRRAEPLWFECMPIGLPASKLALTRGCEDSHAIMRRARHGNMTLPPDTFVAMQTKTTLARYRGLACGAKYAEAVRSQKPRHADIF